MATCRDCHATIEFEETPGGRKRPLNLDGTVHFATCPELKRDRLPDDECLQCGSHDVERLAGKGQHWGAIKCRACGKHRWLRKPAA